MRLQSPIRAVIYRRARFRIADTKPLPTGITLRLYDSADRDECLAIYRDNAVGRFPDGFVGFFADFLDRPDYLKVVLCAEDRPVAVGGIGWTPFLISRCAWLIFGVVSPAFHGRGLGTALLLARLSLLPAPGQSVRLFMTNVANSQTFFARFGFASVGSVPSGRSNIELLCSSALLDSAAWRQCRERVESLGLALPNADVPRIDPLRPPPGQENQTGIMVVQDWKLTSKLNQAVLIQLAGVIGLFVVSRPYNWLGWVLIVVGGVLYRVELKRRKAKQKSE
jgi:GNAT superfamily N-acetyltransferase